MTKQPETCQALRHLRHPQRRSLADAGSTSPFHYPLTITKRRKENGEHWVKHGWNSGEATVTVSERTEGERVIALLSSSVWAFALLFFLPRYLSAFPPPVQAPPPLRLPPSAFRRVEAFLSLFILFPLSPPLPLLSPSSTLWERKRKREKERQLPFGNPQPLLQGRVFPSSPSLSLSFSLSLYLSILHGLRRRCSAVIGSFYAAIFTFLLKATSLCRWVMAKGERECERGAPWSPRVGVVRGMNEGRDMEGGRGVARSECGQGDALRGWGGLAFNYLGFPREEAIHLRVYAIFEGEIALGSRCAGAFFEILRLYIPAYSFARPTDWEKRSRTGEGLFTSTPPMNSALSHRIVRFL